MADTGTRYRLVTTQDGTEHVSTVVLNHDEAQEQLQLTRSLHEQTGWNVMLIASRRTLLAEKLGMGKRIRRTIQIKAFTPLNDVQAEEVT